MRLLLAAVLAAQLSAGAAITAPLCGGNYAADPIELVTDWLPDFERLYENLPALSPQEELWLEAELVGDGNRAVNAINSQEYAIRAAKRDAASLLGFARFFAEHDPETQLEDLLFFAYVLVDPDPSLYLARLIVEGVIAKDALPFLWTSLAEKQVPNQQEQFDDLREVIGGLRASLARHVLACTLPTALDALP